MTEQSIGHASGINGHQYLNVHTTETPATGTSSSSAMSPATSSLPLITPYFFPAEGPSPSLSSFRLYMRNSSDEAQLSPHPHPVSAMSAAQSACGSVSNDTLHVPADNAAASLQLTVNAVSALAPSHCSRRKDVDRNVRQWLTDLPSLPHQANEWVENPSQQQQLSLQSLTSAVDRLQQQQIELGREMRGNFAEQRHTMQQLLAMLQQEPSPQQLHKDACTLMHDTTVQQHQLVKSLDGIQRTLRVMNSTIMQQQMQESDAVTAGIDELRQQMKADRQTWQDRFAAMQLMMVQQMQLMQQASVNLSRMDSSSVSLSSLPSTPSTRNSSPEAVSSSCGSRRRSDDPDIPQVHAAPSTPTSQASSSGAENKKGPRRQWQKKKKSEVYSPLCPPAKRIKEDVGEDSIMVPPCAVPRTFVQNEPCIRYRKINQKLEHSSQRFERCAKCQPLLRTAPRDREPLIREVCCCFTGFRKLYQEGDAVRCSGYLSPSEASESVMNLYQPQPSCNAFTKGQSTFVLAHLIGSFLRIAAEEGASMQGKKASWKCITRCREMCDTCATTIFNAHFVCETCGFAVCPECWRPTGRDAKKTSHWPLCHGKKEHKRDKLMLTQVLPGTVLSDVARQLSSIALPQVALLPPSTLPGSCKLGTLASSLLFLTAAAMEERPEECLNAFRHDWAQGKPAVVAGVHKKLQQEWSCQGLSSVAEGGNQLADVVDCTGLPNTLTSVTDFWRGYEEMDARLVGVSSRPDGSTPDHPPLYKLKDWPSKDELGSVMPQHFEDLMHSLPFSCYTRHDGEFNLVNRLPSGYVKPDLGPKMYIAYGTTLLKKSTTNLHLDISDAVNVLVNVTEPTARPDCHLACRYRDQERAEIAQIVDRLEPALQEHCRHNTPGALWHIYSAADKEKIRAFLKKEFAGRLELIADPIHDQNIFLDATLRQRLKDEEGVTGWEFVQCLGDAVFIPAGAPHQVQNLNSCIKVAEDFVSPEHVEACLQLTDEFRFLTPMHKNHEDKLQIKNIIFHSVKDAVACADVSAKSTDWPYVGPT